MKTENTTSQNTEHKTNCIYNIGRSAANRKYEDALETIYTDTPKNYHNQGEQSSMASKADRSGRNNEIKKESYI